MPALCSGAVLRVIPSTKPRRRPAESEQQWLFRNPTGTTRVACHGCQQTDLGLTSISSSWPLVSSSRECARPHICEPKPCSARASQKSRLSKDCVVRANANPMRSRTTTLWQLPPVVTALLAIWFPASLSIHCLPERSKSNITRCLISSNIHGVSFWLMQLLLPTPSLRAACCSLWRIGRTRGRRLKLRKTSCVSVSVMEITPLRGPMPSARACQPCLPCKHHGQNKILEFAIVKI
jgi:hypothetical protein